MQQHQLLKITEKHVNPALIPKMRTKYAVKIFSNAVTNFINLLLNIQKDKIILF